MAFENNLGRGSLTGSAPSISNRAPIPPASTFSLQKIFLVLGFLLSSGTLFYLLGEFKEHIEWKSGITHRVNELEKDFKELNDKVNFRPEKLTQISKDPIQDIWHVCYIGALRQKHKNLDKTKMEVPYFDNENICEVNYEFNWGKNKGKFNLGDFVEIYNPKKDRSSWAMIIGYYHNKSSKERALALSQSVIESLFLGDNYKGVSLKVKLMTKKERDSNCQRIRLFQDVYKLKD